MSETPTYEQVLAIQRAILLDTPVPPGFPETERAIRQEIERIVDGGAIPDVPRE